MKNKGAKPKVKRKGSASAFGCDLTEYLETSGQDVPLVLKSCAEFIETHGVVDGIYRLSGVTSNIQKLRQEFGSDQCPDLTREIYLQDIHCVGSLCKLYFRELPNPLLTYELYKKFTEAVSCAAEGEQLSQMQNVIRELPPSHYRTLEYLSKHLTHIASFSSMTNMHTRNLALVWAPNLLRSKEIEASGCNGDAAFLEVRVQQVVIEFILNHVDQIFNSNTAPSMRVQEGECKVAVRSMTLPSLSLPMKLVSLEEAQARSLAASHPARKERRENSLPEIVPVTDGLFHTVIDLPDSKRKLSTKSKKWKSIFNLGRSGSEGKSKLSRNGSVFVRGQKLSEKATIRPAKSMDSLCSVPIEGEDEKTSRFKRSVAAGGFFIPVLKSRTAGTNSSYDLSNRENEWEQGGAVRAEGGTELQEDKGNSKVQPLRPPPEQLKVFRIHEDLENEQTSPKIRRMFYSSNDSSVKSNFPGSLFPLEASPRHQRKAINISEPFAVSVPLRVSAVISTNSTPCRAPARDKPSLSSLDELSASGLERAIMAGFEGDSSTGPDGATSTAGKGQEEKEQATKTQSHTVSVTKTAAGFVTEEEKAAKKPEPIDPSKPATENTTTAVDNFQWEERLTLEQTQLPITDSQPDNGMDDGKCLSQDASKAKDNDQQETVRAQAGDPPIAEEDDDEHGRTLLESLWPEIQQELKIIESEEDLPFVVNGILETSRAESPLGPGSESCTSLESTSFSSSSEQTPTPLEKDDMDKAFQDAVKTSAPCFVSKEKAQEIDNQSHKSERSPQESCTLNLLQLETDMPGNQLEKLIVFRDAGNDVSLPQDKNIHSMFPLPELSRNEPLSDTRGLCPCPHQAKEEGSHSNAQPALLKDDKNDSASTVFGNQPEKDKPTSSSWTISVKEDQLSVPTNEAKHPQEKQRSSLNKLQKSFEHEEEESWTDTTQSLELVEPWEDHQWVTSPLHSPKFKNVHETKCFQLLKNGESREFYRRPEFSRSLSLDSKDTRMGHWTVKLTFMSRNEDLLQVNSGSENPPSTLQFPHHSSNPDELYENWLDLSETPSKCEEKVDSLTKEKPSYGSLQTAAVEIIPTKMVDMVPPNSSPALPLLHSNSLNSSLKVKSSEDPSKLVDAATKATALSQERCFLPKEYDINNPKGEGIPYKTKIRPTSLNLDTVFPTTEFFKLENLGLSISSGGLQSGRKELKIATSSLLPAGSCKPLDQCKPDSWKAHFDAQDLEIDYLAVAHATTGRRNSAPVSVSAVRTSFMIKMCQARAVPVIPPKLQYTQIPQPLQAQNTDSALISLEKEESIGQTDPNLSCRQTFSPACGHLDSPKSPRVEKKAKEEKENSDPSIRDLTSSRYTAFNPSLDSSLSSRISSQEAPVLRRKRTSDSETAGDPPLFSKMERSSGFSKPSYRSRPGRPQSLILFSPPFPIMDHPPSTDSRILLSPIKSPVLNTSQDSVCSELSENSQTPDGVTLRNKMTIPKNGQRLETSTSCFYQPHRRSVILDSRNGRQIE
ncbi:rho GTPase-activating protein 31 [Microcaecilia unicolor]|uniref:Rho GTPase-activating protein 31 n=1 Tax=Microcaecilia unicolor TaxID=1415580 RepID=A0A6P7XWH2_9AMPH|nr:rho GTPase-activating protein 31 [Microcaecilia unicolor]XP_030059783.1 rho GTPase-activating protein 31 [Microcaecilia unicolor]